MPSITEPVHGPPQVVKPAPKALNASTNNKNVNITDIRQAAVEGSLKDEIEKLFHPQEGPRKLPTMLLYDETGLQLFEKITYLDEYYLTRDEIQVLERSAAAIAKTISSGSLVLELGSGNLRKVQLLLQALEDAGKSIDYYALDLSEQELSRTLQQLPSFRHVRCHALLGTYDDGREWLKTPSISARRKCVLNLGSSIGNFHRDEAATFLNGFADVLRPSDSFLLGLDSCTDAPRVYHAYNDREGITHQFILNGLQHANKILGSEVFAVDEWQVIGEYVYDKEGGRHQAFLAPVRDTTVLGETVKAQERVQVEQSLKYSGGGLLNLFSAAGVIESDRWMTDDNEYGLHLLNKHTMAFSLKPSGYVASHIPSLKDWQDLWSYWDAVTQHMLPNDELLDKPIKLRNACIFYLGHIPTFLDIQLTKTTKTAPTEPAAYWTIFERGIDPDVDNPDHCHAHSEIPNEWPLVDEILQYQDKVRARLIQLYATGESQILRDVGRGIWVGLEHEIMHLETLLYMMLQSDKTLPPPGTTHPNFEALAKEAYEARTSNDWFTIPEQDIVIGLDDPEEVLDSRDHFGWDNEKPARKKKVHSFQSKGRPITNEEYAQYMFDMKTAKLPASWAEETTEHVNGTNRYLNGHNNGHTNGYTNGHTNGGNSLPPSFMEGKSVKTVYGPVPLKYALDWPIYTSYDELAGCAAWMGGRIPTFEEARSIYTHVDYMRKEQAEHKLGKTVPAVNGHLSNDGVQETPPSQDPLQVNEGSSSNDDIFIDLSDANVGFKHWHPVAVTGRGNRLAGQAEMGGVWEWTSSPLARHEGFEPISLYPGYTADFFDDKHNIVLGGSWATHPRIAGRKSFVNWYQRNYPYPWVGARLVRDL